MSLKLVDDKIFVSPGSAPFRPGKINKLIPPLFVMTAGGAAAVAAAEAAAAAAAAEAAVCFLCPDNISSSRVSVGMSGVSVSKSGQLFFLFK